MDRGNLWRERLLPILGFPGLFAAALLLDQVWLAPKRATMSWPDAAAFWASQAPRRPQYGDTQLRLGLAYASTQRWPEAVAAYEDALRANPELEDAASGRATALSALGRGAEGRADLERFYSDHPLCAVCALSLAFWDADAGETARAIALAERAAELARERDNRTLEHDGWLAAGHWLLEQDPARALDDAQKALASVPGSATARQLSADARARLGRVS